MKIGLGPIPNLKQIEGLFIGENGEWPFVGPDRTQVLHYSRSHTTKSELQWLNEPNKVAKKPSNSLLMFYVEDCSVAPQNVESLSFPLIGGSNGDYCLNTVLNVQFLENERIQKEKSSFQYNVFAFYNYEKSRLNLICNIRFCLVDHCPLTIGLACK